MNFLLKLFDRALFALANWRAANFPRVWIAHRADGQGEYSLGELKQFDAIAAVTKDGAHKIKYVDPDQGIIIYD